MLYKNKNLILNLVAILCVTFYFYSCSQEKSETKTLIVKKTTYNFLDSLSIAEINTAKDNYVTKSIFIINGEEREVLFEHPNSEVIFEDICIRKGSELWFGIAINFSAWEKPGDGVAFEINIIDEQLQKSSIYKKYIDPKNNMTDRRWFDENIDLNKFAGQKISIIFKTNGGPKNNWVDWAGWSRPRIVSYVEDSITESPKHTNVILISIDTLRPDHLNVYGYSRSTSPNIDSVAKEGIIFENAIAQSNWTIPSHMSLLTSLYASVHKGDAETKLDSSWITLTEVLNDNEYSTAGFIAGRKWVYCAY